MKGGWSWDATIAGFGRTEKKRRKSTLKKPGRHAQPNREGRHGNVALTNKAGFGVFGRVFVFQLFRIKTIW
jgi:hypothetical protein